MIIGLTGSFGAGKGEVVEYLKTRGFKHYSARELIFEEAEKRGLDRSKGREVTIPVANDMRAKNGPAFIAIALYEKALAEGGDAVLESFRAVAEVKKLQELGGFVLGVDADPGLRYERIVKRGSETDNVTYEEWRDQEIQESNPDDPTKQDIFGALKESDVVIRNEGTLEELRQQIDEVIEQIDYES